MFFYSLKKKVRFFPFFLFLCVAVGVVNGIIGQGSPKGRYVHEADAPPPGDVGPAVALEMDFDASKGIVDVYAAGDGDRDRRHAECTELSYSYDGDSIVSVNGTSGCLHKLFATFWTSPSYTIQFDDFLSLVQVSIWASNLPKQGVDLRLNHREHSVAWLAPESPVCCPKANATACDAECCENMPGDFDSCVSHCASRSEWEACIIRMSCSSECCENQSIFSYDGCMARACCGH